MGSTIYKKRKRLNALKLSETSMNIDEMIHLASRKLYPIIEMLVDNSTNSEQFLTKQEFADAAIAANIIKEICNVLVYADFNISMKDVDFVLENHKVTFNEQGQIYVKTGLLLQLIDLYNLLEDAKDTVDEFYETIGIHSFVQTDSSYSFCSKESLDSNRIILRLTKPLTRSTSSMGFIPRNFIVMPSTTEIKESKSEITNNNKNAAATNGKSTGFVDNEKVSGVTDVYGAKKIVIRCIYDLQEVSKFLDTERKDVTSIVSPAEIDTSSYSSLKQGFDASVRSDYNAKPTTMKEKSYITDQKIDTSEKSNKNGKDKSDQKERTQPLIQTEGGAACCCPECFADLDSGADLKECDDDRVIICIKGCNEDEGDVQIVIRQCPDCKKAAELPDKSLDKGLSPDTPKSIPPKKTQTFKEDPTIIVEKETVVPVKVESTSLHNKDSQGSYVCSEEDDNDDNINLPSTPTPTNSTKGIDSVILENRGSFPENTIKAQRKFVSSDQQQSRVDCSKIRMFETTNLCLQTDTGQELVISVTVTPKDFNSQKLSLRDIFSEDDYDQTRQLTDKQQDPTISSKWPQSPDSTASSKKTESARMSNNPSFKVQDKIIPLARTKICSSVDFDVTTLQTRIREKGIQHNDPQIVVKLKDLGIDNLLRACRPAKCCRRAVLNEKMKKCLPYPPSLRSLPLDEEDINVINQSLQMSVQKVKNSTNLKKDFYASYTYSIKPFQTIMYFFVEPSNKNINNSINKKDALKKKLSYYINLVNDVEYGKESKFDILYFGVGESFNNNLTGETKNKFLEVKQSIPHKHSSNIRKGDVISTSLKWEKNKCNNYENRSMLTDCKKVQNSSFKKKNSKLINKWHDVGKESKTKSRKTAVVSKIPIFIGNNKKKRFNPESSFDIEEIEQEVYGISLDSLPREHILLNANDFKSLLLKSSLSSKDKLSNKEKLDTQIDLQSHHSRSPDTSRNSVPSNSVLRKTKRKKRAFYLPRSQSDISLKILKNKCKHTATSTQTKGFSKEQQLLKKNKNKYDNKMSSTSCSVIKTFDSSRMILSYFSKMIYKIMVREAFNENTMDDLMRTKKYQECYSKATENKSLYELYHRFSNQNNELFNNFEIRNVEAESTYHDLKAKRSQSRIVFSSTTNKRNICIINNLAIQTSVLFNSDNKQCQTSNSLIAYLLQPEFKPEDNTYLQKKRIFKKIYNSAALSGIPNSCDQLEKFIVIFKSDHSLKSNRSDNTDFLSSASEHSERSIEHISQLTIGTSLMKLKETLEKYETVKNEIDKGPLQDANVNPIEYFVYQMCACNKFNKKQSVMQKILNKSKGLFTSIEKDVSNRYKNDKEFFGTHADRRVCYQCGCLLSKCTNDKHSSNKPSDSSFCQCPSDNKKKSTLLTWSKHKKSATNNYSKITNASMASVRSLRTYFKKSLSNIKSKSKEKNTYQCACDKNTSTTKSVNEICIPANKKTEPCPKKDTSTFTTKDSGTQKCECNKCENFADDGTCCCSHCLGCLDKSSDAKPDNNNIGTSCICQEEPASKDSKGKEDKSDIDGMIEKPKKENKKTTSLKDAIDVKRQQYDTGKNKNQVPNKVDSSNDKGTSPENKAANAEDKKGTIVALNSLEKVPVKENSLPANENPNSVVAASSLITQINEEVINLEANKNTEGGNTSHDTTSYYFLTSSPNMFSQFGLGSRNPFEQYMLNFPHVNVVQLDSDSFLNE